MFALRRATFHQTPRSCFRYVAGVKAFHSTPRSWVKVGDAVPDVELMEGSPGNQVSLAQELKSDRGVIVGVPAAFSPACSSSHIPGYINSPNLKNAGKVFVVSVNDPFVMKAWGADLDPTGKSGSIDPEWAIDPTETIRFIADPALAFTKALDLSFDGAAIFGGDRGKRYALVIENGKVKEAYVEPDNIGVNVSAADKVLQNMKGDW